MAVGRVPLLNKAVPNGPMALKWAYANYRGRISYQPVPGARGRELAWAALGRGELTGQTAENLWLAAQPPHVVRVVMESFGSNMLEFDRAGSVDLLGSLRRHLEEDFLFRRFLPEENGTMPSLAALLFSCPDQAITVSEAKLKKLGDTAFDVFKGNGYETAFIYSGRGSWNNIGPYLAGQGVDRICDQNYLVTLLAPEKPNLASEAGVWGLPDEYAFSLARRLLEQSSKPMFIVILTISNHPPYSPPPQYSPRPIVPEAELTARLEVKENDKLDMLYAFQYANSSLGDFVTAVKEGPLGGRTIIAATGDHQMRSLKAKYPEELLLDTAVPFYLYAPKPLLAHIPHNYAPERPGSHKDILPTLYALSLSEASYYSVGGRNLLAERDDPALAFGYNVRLFIDSDGVCSVDEALAGDRYAYMAAGLRLGEDLGPIPAALAEKIRAFGQLRRWQINARVAGEE
jgi:phosphoglycerol transferase MdoB-like AlkP superfamily enzyme